MKLSLRTKPEEHRFKIGKPKLKMPRLLKRMKLKPSGPNPIGLTGMRKGFPKSNLR